MPLTRWEVMQDNRLVLQEMIKQHSHLVSSTQAYATVKDLNGKREMLTHTEGVFYMISRQERVINKRIYHERLMN